MYDRVLCRVYVLHHGGGLSMPKIYHMNAKTSKISQSLFNHKQCLSIEFFVNMLLQNGKQSFEPYISKTVSCSSAVAFTGMISMSNTVCSITFHVLY